MHWKHKLKTGEDDGWIFDITQCDIGNEVGLDSPVCSYFEPTEDFHKSSCLSELAIEMTKDLLSEFLNFKSGVVETPVKRKKLSNQVKVTGREVRSLWQ
jgi:hypothetical protein